MLLPPEAKARLSCFLLLPSHFPSSFLFLSPFHLPPFPPSITISFLSQPGKRMQFLILHTSNTDYVCAPKAVRISPRHQASGKFCTRRRLGLLITHSVMTPCIHGWLQIPQVKGLQHQHCSLLRPRHKSGSLELLIG